MDEMTGEIICESCGRVWAEKTEIVEPPRNAVFGLGRHLNGAVTSSIMYDMGLSTTIGNTIRDWNGKSIAYDTKKKFVKLRALDSGCTYATKSLQTALVGLNTMATKLAIPDAIIERAAHICRKAMENKLAKGRNITSVSCAALYAACRECNILRTIDDIIQVSNTPKKRILRAYKALLDILDMHPNNHNVVALLNRLANQVNVSEQTKRNAFFTLDKIKTKLTGRNPNTIAATTLYIACIHSAENKTQKHICDAAGICVTTIRSTMSFLEMNSEDCSKKI